MTAHRIARVVATTALVTGCALALAPSASAADDESVYRGTAVVSVGVNDYCDLSSSAPQRRGTESFTMPVTLTVSAPQVNGAGEREDNPVHLQVGSDSQSGAGAFLISSAQSYATSGGSLGLQYWNLQQDGGALGGTLVDDHIAEGAALNSLWMNQNLVPCQPQLDLGIPATAPMARGTTLTGALGNASGDMHVAGHSTDGLYDFRIDMDLTAS